MFFVNHRVNTLEALKAVPINNGAEIDVRYHHDDIILHHDPFGHHKTHLVKLEDFLKQWTCAGPLILNVKTEGIELNCIQLLNYYQVKNWFFLDLSMPYFVKYSELAENGSINGFSPNNLAIRFSEREPIEYALNFAGKVNWVWVDCFSKMPLSTENAKLLTKAGFQICVVSPELQQHHVSRISEFKELLKDIEVAAICTKHPALWDH